MNRSIEAPKYVIIILYIITGSLTNFGAIDILAPQWIYLASINIFSCIYFLFFNKDYLESLSKLFSTAYIYVYIVYFIWNLFSYFYAVNPVETLINLPRIGNTFFAIFFCFLLISGLKNRVQYISSIFFLFLLAEMISYYYDLSEVYPREGLRVIAIKGFAGNKNITAASISFKIPFAIYILLSSRNRFIKSISYLILTAGIFAISLIEARAAILSTVIVFILILLYFVYSFFKDKQNQNIVLKNTLLFASPYLIAFLINMFATSFANDKYRKVTIADTLGKISFTEQSSNGRFNYWGDAWDYIKEKPIFASGLGNWKIESIDKGKEHISGYTVPYHAHNDFIHVFAETGIIGGMCYLTLFLLIIYYLFKIIKKRYQERKTFDIEYFILMLPLIVYGVDALLNFPVARPLMQSSLAIYLGLIISLYCNNCIDAKSFVSKFVGKGSLFIVLILLIPGLYIHVLSFISLRQQGRLLYEFNNAQYTFTRDELDKISHDFPNLTETAMPIKAMKARYYYLAGNKDEAFKMALAGAKDNPKIHFGNNLYSTFLLQENKIDSAHYYSKLAFDGLPNNMPHYDMYMRTLAYKKDAVAINEAFNRINRLSGGNNPGVWTIYLRTLALTRSLGDPFSMKKAQEGYNKFPTDENIFQLYRILTYGQDRVNKGQTAANEGKVLYEKKDFEGASKLYIQAIDLDPLQYSHALNCGLSFYSLKDFNNALKYLNIATSSKNPDIREKSLRFKALTLISLGDRKGACAAYTNLIGRYPKRMYQQEFVKYCRTK
jgi:O-antigen ligase